MARDPETHEPSPREAVTEDARDTTLLPRRPRATHLAPVAKAPLARDRERYVVHGEHGRGGLGRVMRATDRELERTVALKELLRRDPVGEARFLREAMLTARLEHPGIVPVHEAGRWEDGTPFYAMKLVDGRPLKALLEEAHDLAGRMPMLAHVAAVADAVAYAHGCGIIHRDLKPANVIVGSFGEVVVVDWGLAKEVGGAGATAAAAAAASDEPDDSDGGGGRGDGDGDGCDRGDDARRADSAEHHALTRAGDVVGTPAYMAPEQARGDAVDERTDVYALGSMLYHVLSGQAPYSGVRSAEVLAAVRVRAPDALPAAVPLELRAITERAMARAPDDRYPSARELAEDLRRFLTGQLVGAHSYRTRELVRRWLRRHRAPVAVAAVLLAALAVLAVVGVRRIVAERDAAGRARVAADEQRVAAETARADAIARQHALLLASARNALIVDPTEALAWLAQVPIDAATAPEVRRIAADAIARGVSRHVLRGHASGARGLGFVAGGKLATADNLSDIRVWDLATGQGAKIGAMWDIFYGALATPDGRFATFSRAGEYRIWDTATGQVVSTLDVPKRGWGLAAHPDGVRFAISDRTPRIALWDTATGEVKTLTSETDGFVAFAFSRDGRLLASGGQDGRIRVFDLERGTERELRGPGPRWVDSIALSPDARHLATTGGGASILVWDLETGNVRELIGHDGEGTQVVFSADGKHLFSGSTDQAVRAWDLATGESRQWLGHGGPIEVLALSPDGRWLASGDTAGGLRMWEVATGQVRALVGHRDMIMSVEFSPDGAWLASASKDGTARVWAVDQEAHLALVGHTRRLGYATFSADGRWLATVGQDRAVYHWDPVTGRGVRSGPVERANGELCFLSDESTVLMTYEAIWKIASDGRTEEIAPPSTRARWTLRAPGGPPMVATFDGKVLELGADDTLTPVFDHGAAITNFGVVPDGRVVTTGADNMIRVWRRGEAKPIAEQAFTDKVFGIDGFGAGGAIRVITLGRGLVTITEVPGERSVQLAVAEPYPPDVSPDGSRLLITDRQGVVHIWTPATGEHATLAHEDVGNAVMSPDNTRVYTCGEDGTTRTSTASGVLLGMHRAGNSCWDLTLSPDGKSLVVADYDHVARLWPTDAPLLPTDDAALHAYLASLTSAVVLDGDEIGTPP